ncbi:sulfatase-like hydrolase/transferase [Carboxylicivirga sp. A043]|uniref:sulfatase-like hydrolase/transferase n=1 Tax=Carboxylicivirga litoralis TaxID=2816963 RepID=UPI0021CB1E85|nr:sulfatase-like hydrolase/transferase [Carboxylicivirga sp. A043]MCU4157766.1 sulfatase-like hydrolase/transferase [Carboxylicivirga sp. A043]
MKYRGKGNGLVLLVLIGLHCVLFSCKQPKVGNSEQPNIIVMLVDDAGYADFGFAGSKDIKTPNIDKLAKDGVIFTDAHVTASVCGPSRAGLMTGRYQQRFGFECNPDSHTRGIDLREKTIANVMKSAGYATSAFGKWHLGGEEDYKPNTRGFDYFWGFLAGSRSYFHNSHQDVKGAIHSIRENDVFTTFEGYLTDRLGEQAAKFIHANKEKPFFMYWAPNAVHTPMEATDEDLALFEEHPRQKLAAMTWALDRAVGTIVKQLEDDQILDNTLIFFLSDNGGAHNNQSSNLPLKGFKGNKYEGGQRVPFFMHWPAKVQGGQIYSGLSSSLDIFASSIDAAGADKVHFGDLDGVSLLPFVIDKEEGEPHAELYWRKHEATALRNGDYKLIKVNRIGYRMYNLNDDLGESRDLSQQETETFNELCAKMEQYDHQMLAPLWTEGHTWDTITWMIHEDLMLNKDVRVKEPRELRQLKEQRVEL